MDEILSAIEKEKLPSGGDRVLMVYFYDDQALSEKIYSLHPTVEEWNGKLWGVMVAEIYGELTEAETETGKRTKLQRTDDGRNVTCPIISQTYLPHMVIRKRSNVALDGVAEHAMLHVLSKNMHIKKVVLCLDHDPAGIEASGRLTDILHEKGYACISCSQPACKDWNEDLKAQHGITPVPAKPHPKLEACKEIHYLCSTIKSVKNPP